MMLRTPLRASSSVYRAVCSQPPLHTLHAKTHATNLSRHIYHHSPSIQQTGGILLSHSSLHQRPKSSHAPVNVAHFHSTQRRHGPGALLPVLLAAFKASTTIEVARTIGRIALTFVPLVMFKNRWTKKYIKHHDRFHPGMPVSEEKKAMLLNRIRLRTLFTHVILFIPAALFWLGILASAEQTPLTGRWRLIVLSPEEEDEIAAQLAGPKWYQAVTDILSNEGPPKLIPLHDWRYQWVQDTLHRLESVIPILQHEHELSAHWLDIGPGNPPLPPPAEYPLKPRPRGTDSMRRFCDTLCGLKPTPSAHVVSGPPYSLLIADKPDAANAFSYGFGPDGACGIVVYSGFLDNILSKAPTQGSSRHASATPHRQESSLLSYLFGSLFSIPMASSTVSSHPIPTEEQTTELAILLAHEVAHLVLSHHLETLSSGTIIVPAITSMIADVVRTLVFPVTMIFGPFFNDAIAQVGKVGTGHLIEVGESCTSVKQEVEADVVSVRLLAHAGFDARKAVEFWENRQDTPSSAHCSCSPSKHSDAPPSTWDPARRIMGASHPVHEVRIERLKGELVRWELEKRVAVRKRAEGKAFEQKPNPIWAL